jgi:DNA-damage-inducible protein J
MSLKTTKKPIKTSSVQARLDVETKLAAETVFEMLGMNSSQAITMFFKQVALKKALPFEVNTITTSTTIEEERAAQKLRIARDIAELESGEDGQMLFDPKDIKPFKI